MSLVLWSVWSKDHHTKWKLIFRGRASEALKHYLKEFEGEPHVELRDPDGETMMSRQSGEVKHHFTSKERGLHAG